MTASVLMTTNPEPVDYSTSGADILFRLDENKLEDIPVIENGQLVGSVFEADIYNMDDLDKTLKEKKVSLKKEYVYDNQHVFEIAREMLSSGLSVLPVVNEKEQFLGSISRKDLLTYLSDMIGVINPGAVIVLEVNQSDYVLSQIAQIVESQDAKVLNLFVVSVKDSTMLEVIIRVNSMEIQTLVQTFNRYNYIIKATYTEDEKMYDDLQERYDSLMKYLDI